MLKKLIDFLNTPRLDLQTTNDEKVAEKPVEEIAKGGGEVLEKAKTSDDASAKRKAAIINYYKKNH